MLGFVALVYVSVVVEDSACVSDYMVLGLGIVWYTRLVSGWCMCRREG
jgi:hypothetical protein